MSLLEQLAYKVILGKSITGSNRFTYNEPYESSPVILGENVWFDNINRESPSHPKNNGVISDFIDLKLNEIAGTNAKSYYCSLYEEVPDSLKNKINPITKNIYAPNDRVRNLIPISFGFKFMPRLFSNSNEITLLDFNNWVIDSSAGIVTQEGNIPFTNIKSYVYIGKTAENKIQFYDKQTINNGIIGAINGINNTFILNNIPDVRSEHVFINGILQMVNSDYMMVDNIVFFNNGAIPMTGDLLVISYRTS